MKVTQLQMLHSMRQPRNQRKRSQCGAEDAWEAAGPARGRWYAGTGRGPSARVPERRRPRHGLFARVGWSSSFRSHNEAACSESFGFERPCSSHATQCASVEYAARHRPEALYILRDEDCMGSDACAPKHKRAAVAATAGDAGRPWSDAFGPVS